MEDKSRLEKFLATLGEKLNEQVWFQQLKAKWEEQDPQSRLYLKFAAGGISVAVAFLVVLSSIWSVHRLKKELADKADIVTMIQSANDELRRLREATPAAAQGGNAGEQTGAAWGTYLESTAATAGIDKGALTVGNEKAGTATDMAKEALIDVSLKKVSIRQVVRYAFLLESGARPVKLRNLTIDTKADPEGYMEATLHLSAFNLKQ